MQGSPLRQPRTAMSGRTRVSVQRQVMVGDETAADSFESKASDQRQLLGEMSVHATVQHSVRHEEVRVDREVNEYVEDGEVPEQGEYEEEEEEEGATIDPSRSYEEHLNIESPQKVKVNFNDAAGNSSLLALTRAYRPLFSKPEPSDTHTSPPSVTLVAKHNLTAQSTQGPEAPALPNILSRLTTTFWSAVARPADSAPAPHKEYYNAPSRTHLRSRYGVLASTHPWTLAHMRTLHRMVNSCTSNKSDSIVPKPQPDTRYPQYLYDLFTKSPTTSRSPSGYTFTFTPQLALVVEALMAVLVDKDVVEAMERGEVEFLGDGTAWSHRGLVGGREAWESPWRIKGVKEPREGQMITGHFVASAVGDVVRANADLEKRLKEEREKEENEGRL